MRQFTSRWSLALIAACLAPWHVVVAEGNEVNGAPFEGGDLLSDTWVATDALGRVTPDALECGSVRNDKRVGIFYWTGHTGLTGLHRGEFHGPNDNTKILAQAQNGIVPWPTTGRTHYWGEPELGYYRATGTSAFDFHWADNIARLDDVLEFGTNGDSAPNRRWNYRFEVQPRVLY